MKWIEIITLRSNRDDLLVLDFESLIDVKENYPDGKLEKMEVYRRCTLDTDLSVHLRWNSERANPEGSRVALHLMELLKENGLLNHSIWVEEASK
jgi:hypothetical protein